MANHWSKQAVAWAKLWFSGISVGLGGRMWEAPPSVLAWNLKELSACFRQAQWKNEQLLITNGVPSAMKTWNGCSCDIMCLWPCRIRFIPLYTCPSDKLALPCYHHPQPHRSIPLLKYCRSTFHSNPLFPNIEQKNSPSLNKKTTLS